MRAALSSFPLGVGMSTLVIVPMGVLQLLWSCQHGSVTRKSAVCEWLRLQHGTFNLTTTGFDLFNTGICSSLVADFGNSLDRHCLRTKGTAWESCHKPSDWPIGLAETIKGHFYKSRLKRAFSPVTHSIFTFWVLSQFFRVLSRFLSSIQALWGSFPPSHAAWQIWGALMRPKSNVLLRISTSMRLRL